MTTTPHVVAKHVPLALLAPEGTIGENIAYGVRNASPAAIARAAEAALAARFIEEMDDGYDTLVGERGVRLSGGQRKRLAIARALLTDPRTINDQLVQHSGTKPPAVLKASADQPKRLAGKLTFDDTASLGPKVDVEFDAVLVKEFKAAR